MYLLREVIRETENFTLAKEISGDLTIENNDGDKVLVQSSDNPDHISLIEEWAEDATDEDLAECFKDNADTTA